jgi:hypothetical protein
MAGDGKKPSVEQITEAMETFRGFVGCDVSGYAQVNPTTRRTSEKTHGTGLW